MCCLRFLVKHLLFIINLLFTIVALAIIAAGSYALYSVSTNQDLLANVTDIIHIEHLNVINIDNLKYASIGFIVFGVVIFLISFCGCCGSITENKCMIVCYAIIMFALGGASVYLLVVRNGYYDTARNWLKDGLNTTFYEAEDPLLDQSINAIQYTVKCCGTYGPDFYNETEFNMTFPDVTQLTISRMIGGKFNVSGVGIVSPSCCSTFDLQSFLDDPEEYVLNEYQCTAEDVYEEGCVPKIIGYVNMVLKYLTYTVAGIAGVTVAAFLIAIYISCTIKSKREKRRGY